MNDPSRVDVGNQTCFICRADYPSGNIVKSDPLCVDVAGMLILEFVYVSFDVYRLNTADFALTKPLMTSPRSDACIP